MHDMATSRKHFGSSIFAICSPRMSSDSNSAPSHERLDRLQEEIENIRTKANELVRYIAPWSALSEEVEDACKNANGKLQRIAYLSAWLAQSSVTTSSMSCVGNNGPSGKQLDQLQEEIHKHVTDLLLYIAPYVCFLSEEQSQNARNIATGLVQDIDSLSARLAQVSATTSSTSSWSNIGVALGRVHNTFLDPPQRHKFKVT